MVKVCQRTSGDFADAMSLRSLAMCSLLSSLLPTAKPASMRILSLLALCVAFVSVGCTSVTVKPLDPGVKEVLVRENPKVSMSGFLPYVRKSFESRGIATRVIKESDAAGDAYVVTYTALRSWDLTTYLSSAEFWVHHRSDLVGYAEYHLRGKGGFALTKFQHVETKLDPVFEELLVHYPIRTPAPSKP